MTRKDNDMADGRRLEKTKMPGVYRRHGYRCNNGKKCGCPYIVRWKAQGQSHKQMFDSYDLAREFKGGLDSGKTTRRPLSSETVALSGFAIGWPPTCIVTVAAFDVRSPSVIV